MDPEDIKQDANRCAAAMRHQDWPTVNLIRETYSRAYSEDRKDFESALREACKSRFPSVR